MTKGVQTTLADGTVEYRDIVGRLHRRDGPAVVRPDGTREWWIDGEWFKTEHHDKRGRFHREDGPALLYSDGYQAYYQHGQRHRTDGPAVVYPDGSGVWWVRGKWTRGG